MTTANPCKLHDGTWGVRITGDRARVGETVRVETRAGKTWTAIIARIVWEGEDAMIASTTRGAAKAFDDTYNEGGDGYNPHRDTSGEGMTCSRCRASNDTVEEQYSFGVYAGILCTPCARAAYRDQCGHGPSGQQGTREEFEELEGPGSYDGDC